MAVIDMSNFQRLSVLPDQPTTRSGICFDDLHGLSIDKMNLLAGRGVVFRTEWGVTETSFGFAGEIIASSWGDAERIADERGLGEKVIGQTMAFSETGVF